MAFLLVEKGKSQSVGLRGEYFDGTNFETLVGERTDYKIDFKWDFAEPMRGQGTDDFSIRWTGKIETKRSGEHLFRAIVDDGLRVFIDGQPVIDVWQLADSEAFSGKMWLEKGRSYDFRVEYFNAPNEGEIQLRWQMPGDEPFFGGAFGFNDVPIPSAAFSKNEAQAVAFSKKTETKKVEKVPEKKVEKTPSPTPPKPAEIEKYLPKNVLFQQSKAVFLPVSLPELERLADFLLKNESIRLRIEGHTDTVGDRAQNLILSKKRAEAVADFLIEKGVSKSRLEHAGYGSERPLTHDETAAGCAKNRRVEFLVLEK